MKEEIKNDHKLTFTRQEVIDALEVQWGKLNIPDDAHMWERESKILEFVWSVEVKDK